MWSEHEREQDKLRKTHIATEKEQTLQDTHCNWKSKTHNDKKLKSNICDENMRREVQTSQDAYCNWKTKTLNNKELKSNFCDEHMKDNNTKNWISSTNHLVVKLWFLYYITEKEKLTTTTSWNVKFVAITWKTTTQKVEFHKLISSQWKWWDYMTV